MGLADIIRSAVAVADTVTKDLQPKVQHLRWTSADLFGKPVYDTALLDMIVERKQRFVQSAGGKELLSKHLLTSVGPIAPQGAPGRDEPVDPRDKFILPDGTSGPILAVDGIVDKGTGAPFLHQVWLGSGTGSGSV